MCAVVQVCTGQRQEGRASPGLNSESSIKPGKPRAARWGEGLTLVAEEAAPALLAVTLPRLLTGAVETAWVPDALVTVPALPAHSAPRKTAGQSGGHWHPRAHSDTPRTHKTLSSSSSSAAGSQTRQNAGVSPGAFQHTKASEGLTSGYEGPGTAFSGAPQVVLICPNI